MGRCLRLGGGRLGRRRGMWGWWICCWSLGRISICGASGGRDRGAFWIWRMRGRRRCCLGGGCGWCGGCGGGGGRGGGGGGGGRGGGRRRGCCGGRWRRGGRRRWR